MGCLINVNISYETHFICRESHKVFSNWWSLQKIYIHFIESKEKRLTSFAASSSHFFAELALVMVSRVVKVYEIRNEVDIKEIGTVGTVGTVGTK